jgi:ferredoxin
MSERRLRVNQITCEAHGLCAELLPERITLDDWGYPIVDPTPLGHRLEKHAKRAAAACPTLALLLEEVEAAPRDRPPPGPARPPARARPARSRDPGSRGPSSRTR